MAADGEGNGGEVSVAKNGTPSEAIEIPSSVRNTSTGITYSVTSIANRGFNWCNTTPSITIPEGVTSIGESAFSDCRVATTINIPNSVISIGESAFNNCYALTGITIPSGVTTIPKSAFYNCDALTSITIPSGVTTIGRYAFAYCNNLADITFTRSETTPTIGDNVLKGLIAGVTTVHVPTGMVADYKEAFNRVSSGYSDSYFITDGDGVLVVTVDGLKYGVVDAENHIAKALGSPNASGSITIESSVSGFGSGAEQSESYTVTSIGGSAFQNCTGLTSVSIPNGVTSIGSSAFYGCSGLTSVAIPNSVTSIGDYAFQNCTGLTSVSIPNGVTSIGSSAFYGCSGLTSVAISNSLTSIAASTFSGCSGLTSITIPNSVTSIGSSAFQNCTGLTSVALGTGVASINQYAFSKCSSLSSISVEDGNTSYSSEDGILYNYSKTTLVICPNGKTGSITIPNTVTSIGNSAFYGCSGLTSIAIPEGVTSIGESAFSGCSGLTSVTIPNRVTSIKSLTFFNCPSLTSVTMERSTPPTLAINAFPYSNTGFKIYVPCGSKTAYTSATNWSNSSISSKITATDLDATITTDKYLADCDCTFPSTITIKDGASLSAADYSALSTKLNGKTVNVEKELAIEKWNMIGNLSNTSTYSMLLNNAGNSTDEAHAFAVRQFDYTNNNYGSYLHYTDNTPEDYGAFFAWPFENLYETGVETNADATVTLTQAITSVNTSSVAFSATNNNSDKWFALSNPYIGRLNLNAFYTANTSSIQGTKAYVWDISQQDANMSSVTGDWKEVAISSGTPALYPATGFLIAGQNASTTFNFTTSQILTGSATATYKAEEIDKEIVFTVLSNGIEKKAYAQLDEQADNGFDGRDSYILFSSNEDAVNPYFAVEGKNLLDNRFNTLPYTTDLNFNAYKSNVVEFVLSKTDEELELTLIDLADENSETVLNVNDPVTINVTAGQNEGRYQIRFARKNSSISEVANEVNNISIWNSQSVVTINGKNLKRVEIYNTLGQRVYSSSLSGESTTFDSKLNNGAYIIKVYTANSSKSEKVIIR